MCTTGHLQGLHRPLHHDDTVYEPTTYITPRVSRSLILLSAAHAASPATATALLHELADSQPMVLKRIISGTPGMLPKAYRWVGEMEEISAFVSDGLSQGQPNGASHASAAGRVEDEGLIHQGMARLYERIAASLREGTEKGEDVREVKVLKDLVQEAKDISQAKN